jgi:hypothetical protein
VYIILGSNTQQNGTIELFEETLLAFIGPKYGNDAKPHMNKLPTFVVKRELHLSLPTTPTSNRK